MNFKNYITEKDDRDPEKSHEEMKDIKQEGFTKEDILEMLDELTDDELQEVGEEIMEIIYEEGFEDDDDDEDDEDTNESKFFKTRKKEVQETSLLISLKRKKTLRNVRSGIS